MTTTTNKISGRGRGRMRTEHQNQHKINNITKLIRSTHGTAHRLNNKRDCRRDIDDVKKHGGSAVNECIWAPSENSQEDDEHDPISHHFYECLNLKEKTELSHQMPVMGRDRYMGVDVAVKRGKRTNS